MDLGANISGKLLILQNKNFQRGKFFVAGIVYTLKFLGKFLNYK